MTDPHEGHALVSIGDGFVYCRTCRRFYDPTGKRKRPGVDGTLLFNEPMDLNPGGLWVRDKVALFLEDLAFKTLFGRKGAVRAFLQNEFPVLADPLTKWSWESCRPEDGGFCKGETFIASGIKTDRVILAHYQHNETRGRKAVFIEVKSGHGTVSNAQNEFIRAVLAEPGKHIEHLDEAKAFILNVVDWDFSSHGSRSLRVLVRRYEG